MNKPMLSETFVFTTKNFDEEYMLQISINGKVLVTVGRETGNASRLTRFVIWDLDGLDENGSDAEPISAINIGDPAATGVSIEQVWKYAVLAGYEAAIKKLRTEGY